MFHVVVVPDDEWVARVAARDGDDEAAHVRVARVLRHLQRRNGIGVASHCGRAIK